MSSAEIAESEAENLIGNNEYIFRCPITYERAITGSCWKSYGNSCSFMHLSSAFPGRGTPGLPGGNQLKLKKSAPQYPGLSGLLGLFLARGLGDIFRRQWVAAIVSHGLTAFLISPGWRLCFQIMPEGSEN